VAKAGKFDLVDLHKKNHSNSEVLAFFLLSGRSSAIAACGAAEDDVDAILAKPFSMEVLRETFQEVLSRKATPSVYDLRVQEGKNHFKQEQWLKAMDVFQMAIKEDPRPALACYYLGEILSRLGRRDEALKTFETGLKFQPDHYRCMM